MTNTSGPAALEPPAATEAPAIETPTQQHWRPRVHFTARDSWLNDPNGLLHHEGVYHLFFQNNPSGSTWGNMSWGHATSQDLTTWQEQPVAIACTPQEHVYSGSAVADVRNTAGFAGPGQCALVAIYTSAYTEHSHRPGVQAQSLAYSLDAGRTWRRYAGNPVLDIGARDFRDPKVFWYGGDDGHWVMVVVEASEHRVAVYTSADLKEWTLTSRFGPAHATGGVWECPDLFPLPVRGTGQVRWVLLVSLNPGGIAGGSGTQYFVGHFDGTTFTPERLSSGAAAAAGEDLRDFDWLDHGRDYYAAVSFNDVPDGRRLTIGWAGNWDYAASTPTAPWRSAMSLVRELDLVRDAGGRHRIAQRPVLPTDGARPENLLVHRVQVPCGPGQRWQLVLATGEGDDDDRVSIVLDGDERTLSCDRTRSGAVDFHPAFPGVDSAPLLSEQVSEVLVVADGCVLEVYADGGLSTITQLVFPAAPLRRLHQGALD
ncbi:GH32 C-terminal domain-containing protein [Kineococcus indalonis]|uniref:GH32 C-terminal domain-containing protein n=1 Tax=Kineococcus indalonis TaxID=2696566 RepID=UPI00141265DD|nr:glycoside hydrolase family 32 protein [Kineococcus indalonis]NAZ84692.1 glycoside hydrolase family 32 protein [Kineococcus indalonis]